MRGKGAQSGQNQAEAENQNSAYASETPLEGS